MQRLVGVVIGVRMQVLLASGTLSPLASLQVSLDKNIGFLRARSVAEPCTLNPNSAPATRRPEKKISDLGFRV